MAFLFSGIKIPNSIEALLSDYNFNSFIKLEEIMNQLGVLIPENLRKALHTSFTFNSCS